MVIVYLPSRAVLRNFHVIKTAFPADWAADMSRCATDCGLTTLVWLVPGTEG